MVSRLISQIQVFGKYCPKLLKKVSHLIAPSIKMGEGLVLEWSGVLDAMIQRWKGHLTELPWASLLHDKQEGWPARLKWHGSYNLEKSLNSLKDLEKCFSSLSGLEKSLKFTTLSKTIFCMSNILLLAPVVQKVDNAIHWINLCPEDNAIGFCYHLSAGYCYPTFELGPDSIFLMLFLSNIKGAHERKAQAAGAYPGFISMKHLGVLLLPPGQDSSPSQGYPQQYVASTHLYTWVKGDKVE